MRRAIYLQHHHLSVQEPFSSREPVSSREPLSSREPVFSSREPASSWEPVSSRLKHPGGAGEFVLPQRDTRAHNGIPTKSHHNDNHMETYTFGMKLPLSSRQNMETYEEPSRRKQGVAEALHEQSSCSIQTDRMSHSMSPNSSRRWSSARRRAVAQVEAKLQARTSRRHSDSATPTGKNSETSSSKPAGHYGLSGMAQVFEQLSELERGNLVGAVSPRATSWLSSSDRSPAHMDSSRQRSTSPVMYSRRLPPPSLASYVTMPAPVPATQPQALMMPGTAVGARVQTESTSVVGMVPHCTSVVGMVPQGALLVNGAHAGMAVGPMTLTLATSAAPTKAGGPFPFTAP